MTDRRIGLIWAQAHGGVIGDRNTIPWRLPEDMAFFRDTTMDHPVIMGRRTWDSLPPAFRPLKGRHNIVITRQNDWSAEGAHIASSVEDALEQVGHEDAWVVGGAQIYRAAIQHATELLVTEIDSDFAGDALAPPIGPEWREVELSDPAQPVTSQPCWTTSKGGLSYRIRRYIRA